ncbi:hypothetical protein ACS0TY_022437 [Phlomoides rotata]
MARSCYLALACALLLVISFEIPCLVDSYTSLATDQYFLLSLKSVVISDPFHIFTKNWTNSSSVCSWIGVTCGLRHHRVTALNISSMGLSGPIPPQLGNLSFLVSLDLSNNFYTGTLPPEFSLLHRLRFIFLRRNNLTGAIPSAIFNISTLRRISLAYNELSGSLPTDMCSNLPFLQFINLNVNKLSGEIPSNLSQCQQLQVVSLSYNSFSGQIPAAFGKLTSLRILLLGENYLNGVIPTEMGNLQNLVELAIEHNQITGTLSLNIFNMSTMEKLTLQRNKLSGSLSRDIGNFTMLKVLDLTENRFTSVIPKEIGQLSQLEILALRSNNFTGSIPPQIFNISTLRILDLASNDLSGRLPAHLCTGSPILELFTFEYNSISGEIPHSISNCAYLKIFDLGDNKFTGIVPHSLSNLTLLDFLQLSGNNLRIEASSSELSFITSLTMCTSLRYFGVSGNPLGGIIPPSIGNFSSSLQYFEAFNCKIKGTIPDGIGNLSNLIQLDLSKNNLSGIIPPTFTYLHKIQGLDLHNNNMGGSIPEGLCDIGSWYIIDLSQNKLSGLIPECFGNFISLRGLHLYSNLLNSSIPSGLWRLKDLLELDLSSNSLTGFLPLEMGNLVTANYINLSMNNLSQSIPNTIGNLRSLVNLSLAHNRLEGSIPVSVGSMISLVALDLSNNDLSGSIPKSLEELQQLDYLNVSFNSLSGDIPSGGPFRNFTMESFKGNDALCGSSSLHGIPICHIASRHKSTWKKVEFSLFILAGVVALITIVTLLLIYIRCKRKDQTISGIVELASDVPQRISYYEIMRATEHFNESNLLGTGSYGSVYRGILGDGKVIAVKVFNQHSEAAFHSFDVECEVLRNIRHRNLTQVLSSCSNEEFKALVLEYMPNANLEKWLYSHNYFLDVNQRLDIMIDVAFALEYLHHGYSTPIVHCDLKPSNVLLDDEMVAHVSDFGISKLLGEEQSTVLTNTLATLGYIAPEYGLEGLVSTRCDVYSYGVMLMETFTRKRPNDDMFGGDLSLTSWVECLLPQAPNRVVDPNLFITLDDEHGDKILQCVSSILVLALKCSTESPRERINIKEALVDLQKIKRRFFSNA